MGGSRSPAPAFRVGATWDFLDGHAQPAFGDIDIGLGLLDRAGIEHRFLSQGSTEVRPEEVLGLEGLLVLTPTITRRTLQGADRLLVIARFGVGYDSVDVEACTERGIVLTITPEGVRRPVAHAGLTMVLALSHRLFKKNQLVRDQQWSQKSAFMGTGITGRVIGVIGFGNIGRELCRLSAALGMVPITHDPFVVPEVAVAAGVEPVDLRTLLVRSDFVVICCALTPQTRHLLNAERLALMRPSAYLINVARGPIVDGQALAEALGAGRIQGAGLDVFETEPPDPDDPLLKLENVILSPHALCWTDECFEGMGRQACQSIVDIAEGRVPEAVVNRPALDHPGFRSRLERYARTMRETL